MSLPSNLHVFFPRPLQAKRLRDLEVALGEAKQRNVEMQALVRTTRTA
jgi:hypothetical protein